MSYLNQYIDFTQLMLHQKGTRKLIRDWYKKLFNVLPPEGVETYLVQIKIEYYLWFKHCREIGKPIGKNLMVNYIASQAFKLNKFSPHMRKLIETVLKSKSEA